MKKSNGRKSNFSKHRVAPLAVIALGFSFLILAYVLNLEIKNETFTEETVRAVFNEGLSSPKPLPGENVQSLSAEETAPKNQSLSAEKIIPPIETLRPKDSVPLNEPAPPNETPQPTPSPTPTPTPTPIPDTVITFAGDILLDSSVRRAIESVGIQNVFPPESRQPFIDADIAVANLEMAISLRGSPMPDKEYTFCGDPVHSKLLPDMGLDIVSLANNHSLDYGRDAFADTLDFLDGNEIAYVGGGRNKDEAMRWETFEVNGKSIAFLAASRVIPVVEWYAGKETSGLFGTYDPTELNEQIAKAKAENDYVFVYVHWGVERSPVPEEWQRNMARGYIIAGADLVVGSHPHILQGFEIFDGKLIAYSLGNFIFTDGQKDTGALEVTLSPEGAFSYKFLPYEIVSRCTSIMTDEVKIENLRRNLNNVSINTELNENFEITQIAAN